MKPAINFILLVAGIGLAIKIASTPPSPPPRVQQSAAANSEPTLSVQNVPAPVADDEPKPLEVTRPVLDRSSKESVVKHAAELLAGKSLLITDVYNQIFVALLPDDESTYSEVVRFSPDMMTCTRDSYMTYPRGTPVVPAEFYARRTNKPVTYDVSKSFGWPDDPKKFEWIVTVQCGESKALLMIYELETGYPVSVRTAQSTFIKAHVRPMPYDYLKSDKQDFEEREE